LIIAVLFDHLVGGRKQRWRHGEAERLGSRGVDDQLKLGRLLNREIARLLSLENAIDIAGGAAVWMAAHTPLTGISEGSRRTATRFVPGAICLSSSSHLPPTLYSKRTKPVALPLGRARLSTTPEPTGSSTF